MSRSSICRFRLELRFCAALLFAAAALALPVTAYAQNGPPEYFDVTTTSGFGTPSGSYNVTSGVWTTNSAGGDGSLTGWNSGDQMTFGASASDLAGDTFAVNLNTQENVTGLTINSTSANITLNGNGNFYLNGPQTWTVAAGSTLVEDNTWNGGAMNFNGAAVTLAGGGVITFETAIGYNSGASITESDAGAGLTVNLDAANIGGASGGFLLTSGTLNFATAAAATGAFSDFGGNKFTINGGTIDNTSGAAQTLGVGSGGYSIGGNFTFTGSSSLNFGTSPVALTASSTITIGANTLAIGGVVSGAYGITLAGNGTLVLGNSNTYTGATNVTGGILRIQSSTGLGTNAQNLGASVASGGTLQIQGAINVASEALSLNGAGASGATGALENLYGANAYGGPIALGGNTTIASDAGLLTLSNATAISASSATLTLAGAGNGSLAAGLSLGSGGITKNGAGAWTLSGSANRYSGATTVNGGTLTFTGTTTGTSALSVASGATFNYLPGTPGTLDLGGGTITLANNSTIGLAFGSQITSSGAAVVPANSTIFLNISGTPAASTQYTLLTAGSGLTANSPTYVPINTNYTYTMSNSDGAVTLTTGATVGSLSTEWWSGGFTGNANSWVASDGSTASNWASSAIGTATPLLPGPNTSVVFSATAPAVAPTATVLGASLAINSLTIAGTANGLGLVGDGNTLTIAPSSSSNGIAMSDGVPASTIGANVALGAAQTWTNNSTTNASLTVSGNISNNGAFAWTITGTGPTTISGSISGTGGFTKSGTGVLTLSGASTYSGTTNLSAGTLYLNNNAALGNNGITNIFEVTGNATIDNTSGGTITIPQILNVAGGVNLTFGGSSPLIFTNGMNGYSGGTVTFTVNGTAPVTIGGIDNYSAVTNTPGTYNGNGFNPFDKAGTGTLILNGTGYYYGSKTLNLMAGTLDLNGNNILTSPNGEGTNLNISAGTTIDNTSGGLVSLSSNNGIATEFWNGNFTFGGTNALTMAGAITLPSGGVTVTVNGSALVTQTGNVTGNGDTLTTAGSGSMTLSGVIGTGTGGISVTGGTLTLAGANTYTGPTSVSGGTLRAGVASTAGTNGAFGLNSAVTLANIAGTTLSLSNGSSSFNTQIGSLSGGGSTGGNVSLGTAVLTDVQTTSTTYGGVISSSSNTGGLTMNGTGGTLILTAAETYTGPTTVSAGTLQINGTLGNTAIGLSGGTLSLQDAGAVSQGTITYTSGTLSEAVPNAISGSASLAVSAGTLTLPQSNNYTGATTVSAAGVLNVPTAVSIANTNSLDVTGAGNLNISGTVTLASDGTFGVGSGVSGTTGTVTVNSGGTLNIGSGGGATFIGGALNNGQIGSGTLTINGGTVNVAAPGSGSNGVGLDATHLWLNPYVGSGSGAVSTLNLNGGTLSTARPVYDGGSGKSVVDFNGGTLQAAAAFTSGGLGSIIGVTTANVRNGGAIIDTNNFSVLLSENLVHSTVGGDNAIDGGLTVLSSGGPSGVLTLTGTNTYTGPTSVMGGELLISGTESINSSSGITINGSGASLVQTSSVTSTPTITLTQGTLRVGGTVGAVNVANSAGAILQAGNGSSGTYTTGNLSFAGSATVNLLNGANLQVGTLSTPNAGTITLNLGGLTGGYNKLIGYSSYNGANFSDFTLGTITGLASNQSVVGGLVNNTAGNDIVLEVQGMAPGILTWATPKTISANTDILNAGTTSYAYTEDNAATTVNGVAFTAAYNASSLGSNVSMSGFSSTNNSYGAPTGLSAAYGVITNGGAYDSANPVTVTLNNLTSGHVYAAQIWVNDSRGGYQSRTETATSTGGNTVTLSYANTNLGGSAGQYTIGEFVANATTQVFTLTGNQSTQLNGIQVRDVTGAWSGAVNNILDNGGTSSPNLNFTGSNNLARVLNILGSTGTISFADTDGFGNAITNSAISVAAAGVSAGTLDFENNAVAYSLTNASGTTGITGASAVSVTGSGSVTFSSPNTYTGATTVSSGTLNVDSSLGNTAIAVSGGTLSLQTAGAVSQNTITVSGTGSLVETTNNAISGSAGLTVAGSTAALSQANNYTGQTTLTGGTLILGNNGALGSTSQLSINGTGGGIIQASTALVIPSTVPVNFAAGWTISGSNSITFNGALQNFGTVNTITSSITGAGNQATFAGNVYLSNSNSNSDTITFAGTGTTRVSGVIANNAGANTLASNLAKSGTGTLTLTNANTYSGTTNLSGGQLNINNNGALGNDASTNYFEVTVSATIDNTSGGTITVPQILNVASGVNLTFNGSNPLIFTNGMVGYNGGSTVTFTVNGTAPVTIGGIDNYSAITNTPGNYNGGGFNVFTKAGTGTLILNGTGYFYGGKTLNLMAGTLDLNGNNILTSPNNEGTTLNVAAGTTIDNTSGGLVSLSSNNGIAAENWNGNFTFGGTNALTMAGGIALGTASNPTVTVNGSALETQTGNVNLGANTLTIASTSGTGQLALGGVISGGAGTGALAISGGTVRLTGANTYTGGTTLSGGLVNLGIAQNATTSGPLGASGTITLSGGTLQYSAANQFDYSPQFSTAADQQYNVDTNGQSVTWATGLSSAGGSLTKIGAGTLTLTGANAYTGATNVNAGALTVSGTGALSGTSGLSVAGGATFNYLPTTPGQLTLGAGSTLNLANNSIVGLAFGDSIVAAGAATIGNPVYLNFSGSFTSGNTYPVFSAISGLDTGTYYTTNATFAYTLAQSPTSMTITPTTTAALTSAYWIGGLSGETNVWALSNGSASNWATTANGAAQSLVPGAAATVYFTSGTSYENAMTLGAPMSVAGLNSSDPNPVTLNNDLASDALTIGAGGVMVGSGAGPVTFNAPLILGSAQTWTNNSGSALTVGGNMSGSALTLASGTTLNLVPASGGSMTISNAIGGTGALAMTGPGTAILIGTNSYGATTISAGTLQVGNGGTTGSLGTGNIIDNSSLVYSFSSGTTFTPPTGTAISGTGNLSVTAGTTVFNGNITLGGSQSYTENSGGNLFTGLSVTGNSTLIGSSISLYGDAGDRNSDYAHTLTLNTSAANGPINLNISLGGNSRFYQLALFSANAGTGAIDVTGTGATPADGWDLTPVLLTGAVNITANVVASATTTANSNANGGYSGLTVNPNGTTSGVVSGVLSGSMPLTEQGAGTLTLTGANTYSGATTITTGTLRIGNGGSTGTLGTAGVTDNGTLAFNRSDTGLSIGVAISGTGAVQQIGSGTTTLTAPNTYQGATTISAGTLALSNAGGNNIASSGSIRIGGGAFLNVTGLASGTFNLGSSATQTLSGPSSGTGTVTGSVAVASGSTIAAGYTTSSSTLAFSGSLTLNAGAIASFSLNGTSPNGTSNPLINVAGAFSVGGASTINVAFSNNPTGAGTYDLFGYGASSSGFGNDNASGTTIGNLTLTTAGLPGGFSYTLVNNTAGSQIDLSVVSSSLTWGGQNGSTWDTSTSNWYYGGAGTDTPFANSDTVSFGDTQYAGGPAANPNVAISGSGGVSPSSVTFNNTNTPGTGVAYTITSSDSTNDGITGATGITLAGTGTVTLIGQNTYTGATTLIAGILNIGNVNSIGAASAPLIFNGGTLQYASGLSANAASSDISFSSSVSRTVDIESGGATIDLNGNSVTFANSIGGAGPNNTGSLTVLDSSGSTTSMLTLANTNTFAGSIYLDGGIVNFSSPGSGSLAGLGGDGTTSINFAGGTLQWAAGNTADISARTVNIGAGGATFDINGNNVTLANSIGGVSPKNTGGLTLIDSGAPATLTLSAASTYTGATNINGGTLRISNTSGSATGNGSVYVNSGGTLAGGIANPGAIGNVFLSGFNSGGTISPSGGSNISHGLSTVGTLAVASLTLNTTGNATFNYQVNVLSAVADSIAVGGALAIPTSGATDTFNFYSAGTTNPYMFVTGDTYQLMSYASVTGGLSNLNSIFSISNGTVPAGDVATFATTTTSGPGMLDLVISTAYGSATWSSNGSSNYDTPSNWTQASGPYQEYPNGIGQVATFGTGSQISISITGGYTIGQLNFNNGGTPGSPTNYLLSGSGSLTLNNSGSGGGASVNVSSGGLTPALGVNLTLTLADPSLTTTFNIANGSSLDVAGPINQSGGAQQIVLAGGGTLQLDSVANSYSGGTTVNGGSLILDASSSSATTLGSGPLAINGSSSNVTVSSQGLTVGSLSGTGAGQLNVNGNATLTVNQTTTSTFNGTLTLNGGLVLAATTGNTLTVSGAPTLGSGSSITVNSGTLALTNNTNSSANVTGPVTASVASNATLQLAGSSNVLSSAVNITTHGSGLSTDGILSVVGTSTQTVGVISGDPVLKSPVTTYAGTTTVGDGTNAANLTATQILQNTLAINAGSTVTIAPSGSGIPMDEVAATAAVATRDAASSAAAADGDSSSDPFTAIEAAIASGSISSVKGEQLESRIAAIERLATTDPGLDVSLLEDRVLAALPAPSVWSSSGTAPLIDSGSGLLAVDSSMIGSPIDSALGGSATFAPAADFGGSPAAVPEPSALLLAILGGVGALLIALRRRAVCCE